jgi:hypothetical protein
MIQCLFSYQNPTLHMDNQLAKHSTGFCRIFATGEWRAKTLFVGSINQNNMPGTTVVQLSKLLLLQRFCNSCLQWPWKLGAKVLKWCILTEQRWPHPLGSLTRVLRCGHHCSLSTPLKNFLFHLARSLQTAVQCFASWLSRNGKSIVEVSTRLAVIPGVVTM